MELAKYAKGFVPVDDDSRKLYLSMAPGEIGIFTFQKVRSIPWHRKYFGTCREIGEHQDPSRDESSIDYELRILAGHYDVMYVGRKRAPWWFGALIALLNQSAVGSWLSKRLAPYFSQHTVLVPKRIAFDKMTAEEWAQLYPRLEAAICERFGHEYVTDWAA